MKKSIKSIAAALSVLAICGAVSLSACGSKKGGDSMNEYSVYDISGSISLEYDDDTSSYNYDSVIEQDFKKTEEEASSYFTLDRNTANYSFVRTQLNSGYLPSSDSIRIEELLNYFTYDYPSPENGEVMSATAYLTDCPWNEGHKLITVGLKTEEQKITSGRNNYVFLVDISGSMSSTISSLEGRSRLDLVKYSINQALDGLGDNDCVSIVTYASGVEVKLTSTFATESGKEKIRSAVSALSAYGSTNGSGGLSLAYEQAQANFSDNGNNRVIIMSDGDFNVGIYNEDELKEFIQEKAQSGVYLSVLGYGMGNTNDSLMQTLALNGNGNYAYIDSNEEAQKVLKDELNGTMTAVAKDAKAGVTFSESTVESYRIIGYDAKLISEDDFNNTEKDAGEIGSNLCVTVMYEIELKDGVNAGDKLADVAIRFKDIAGGEEDKEVTVQLFNENNGTNDVTFASCVAEFGLLLRQSKYMGTSTYQDILTRLSSINDYVNGDIYKSGFGTLVEKAKNIASENAKED